MLTPGDVFKEIKLERLKLKNLFKTKLNKFEEISTDKRSDDEYYQIKDAILIMVSKLNFSLLVHVDMLNLSKTSNFFY